MKRAWMHRWMLVAASASAGLVGCSGLDMNQVTPLPSCSTDQDCQAGEVCFVDGCGDPGTNLAVEVVPAGQYPQDFAVEGLEATQNLQLGSTATIGGLMLTEGFPDTPFGTRVFLTLSGESSVLPGVFRHYQATVTPAVDGSYSVPVGTGNYVVNATPLDATVPPITGALVAVGPSSKGVLDFAFASPADRLVLPGTVLLSSGAPPSGAFSVQALDPSTDLPLSQPAQVQATDGAFVLEISSEALLLPSFTVEVRPSDPTQLVPVQRFTLFGGQLSATLALVIGDPGAPVTVSGRALDSTGAPVANAAVFIDEIAQGGGHLVTASVHTTADGSFSIPALPTDAAAGAALWILPAPGTNPAAVQSTITIDPKGANLGNVICPDRQLLTGKVKRPDGTAFAGAKVTAVPLVSDGPLKTVTAGADTTTTSDGTFLLPLDPGGYRLDIVPGEKLPRTSRYVTVDADVTSSGSGTTKTVPDVVLSNGRTLQGTVMVAGMDGAPDQPAPLAAVKFYRIVQVNGMLTSMPLAEGLADSNAQYSVTLPVH